MQRFFEYNDRSFRHKNKYLNELRDELAITAALSDAYKWRIYNLACAIEDQAREGYDVKETK